MLTTAELIMNDNTITTASCMFDTGALQASFIRRSVVENNPMICGSLRNCDVQVTLGDGADSSAVSVTSYVQLQIRCTDTSSVSHTTPPIWLLVMPELAEEVIIGLPHLVRHLPDCFVSHIMAAVKDAHTRHAATANLSALHARHTTFRQSNVDRLSSPQPLLAPAGTTHFRLLSLNVNGFNAAFRSGLQEYLVGQWDSHDVLLLQEVKLVPAKHNKAIALLTSIGYSDVAINSIAGQRGVLIAVKPLFPLPLYTCDIPSCDLPDSRGRILTATWSDPPVTVVNAYLPFCNPEIPDIDSRCSLFRQAFTSYVKALQIGAYSRQRHVIVAGDLQVAPTELDESVTCVPPSPGSTDLERMDHIHMVATCSLVDAFRYLHPTTVAYTARSTYPQWTGGQRVADKRIDMFMSTLYPYSASIDTKPYCFTDHAAVSASYHLPLIPPISNHESENEREGAGETRCNVLLSAKDKMIAQILEGYAQKVSTPEPAPEEQNVPHARGLPTCWEEAIAGISLEESHENYVKQISTQLAPWCLEDDRMMQLMLSDEARFVFGTPLDGRGIQGIPDLHLDFDPDIPKDHRAKCRDVPQQIRHIIEEHLQSYLDKNLFEMSYKALYTSPIVIAKKATPPYFRVAIDYRWINQFVRMIQAHTPVILQELHKAQGWEVFADIDWTEAFHQIRLDASTSEMLSIVTTIGPMRPRFMMEGVAPASSVLQNAVSQIFAPIRSESICIFDNILTGGTKDTLVTKVKNVVDLCYKHNIHLNFKKTWIGQDTANYFGYELFNKGYRIDNSRKSAIKALPFPNYGKGKRENTTLVRAFLGFTVYFISFTENYAQHAAPLHDMTKDSFDWNESTWQRDYRADFERFKEALDASMDRIYPDFTLTWILMTDASDVAVGWVLIQLRPGANDTYDTEVIAVGSEKFSTAAEINWPINEKEAYGILRGVETNHNLLFAKPFFIITDHWNLTFTEKAANKKLGRYLLVISQYPIQGTLKVKSEVNGPPDTLTRSWPNPEALERIEARNTNQKPGQMEATPEPLSFSALLLAAAEAPTDECFEATHDDALTRGLFGGEVQRETLNCQYYDALCTPCILPPSTCDLFLLQPKNWQDPNSAPSQQMFRFMVDGQIAFQGRLQSIRCTSTGRNGPCRNRAVFGAPLCWQHLLRDKNLRIKPSEFGKGLFAQSRTSQPGDTIFRRGQTVIAYEGQELTIRDLESRYKTHTAPYAVSKRSGLVEDAALLRSAASHANHSARPNAHFGVNNGNKVVIVADRNIHHNEEILLNYNRGRGQKYLFEASGVSHSTRTARLNTLPESRPVTSPDQGALSTRVQVHDPPIVQYSEAAKRAMFKQCHGRKSGHWGVGKTWKELNRFYPGHSLPYTQVQTLVYECPRCQKYKIGSSDLIIQPKATVLQPIDAFNTISMDGIDISPPDKYGMSHIHISKNLGTNKIHLFASASRDKSSAADAVLDCRTHMPFRYLQTDQGSDYRSDCVAEVNKFLAIHHHIGLVNHPQATGIERDVQEVKRFVVELATSHILKDEWSRPRVLKVAEFLINDDPDESTNLSPNQLTVGRQDQILQQILENTQSTATATSRASPYHKLLLDDLAEVHRIWTAYKARLALKNTEFNLHAPQNKYQPGDLIFKTLTKLERKGTFSARRLGPYEVLKQRGNNVAVRNLVDGSPRAFHVSDCVLFSGSKPDAIILARQDDNQWEVDKILGWRGDPDSRHSTSFLTLFNTGEKVWMNYTTDIHTTTEFINYCSTRAPLQQLTTTVALAKRRDSDRNRIGLTQKPNDRVFIDARLLGHVVYQLKTYSIPDKYSTRYMLSATVVRATRTRATLSIPLLDLTISLTASAISKWTCAQLDTGTPYPDPTMLVTREFLKLHPSMATAALPVDYVDLSAEEANALLDSYDSPNRRE